MYNRGATTMLVIHDVLGDTRFRGLMKRWITEHAYGNVTTAQFIALVKDVDPTRADRWTEFFRQWLYTSYTTPPLLPGGKPAMNEDNFDTYAIPAG
jgi:aminopeptidase N